MSLRLSLRHRLRLRRRRFLSPHLHLRTLLRLCLCASVGAPVLKLADNLRNQDDAIRKEEIQKTTEHYKMTRDVS